MKAKLVSILIAITAQTVLAQSIQKFYVNGKCGYKSADGKIVIQPLYDGGSDFSDGIALVVKNEKRGFINETGKVCIDFIYDDAAMFSSGLARVAQSGKHGFIDKNGLLVIPLKYEFASDFINGLALVCIGNKYGYINIEGQEIIAIQYKEARNFSEGLAAVQLQNGRWTFIDTTGTVAMNGFYDAAYFFIQGQAVIKDGRKMYYINVKGKKLKEIEEKEEK